MDAKAKLRTGLRNIRRAHVEAMPGSTRALLFKIPPAPLRETIPAGATIGLYRATAFEAPATPYARYFMENGYRVALPWFEHKGAAMDFRLWTDPFGESDLTIGPFGLMQPADDAAAAVPDVLFAPLLGFTASGDRLGQGGGHYDRWLADHPGTDVIGMAWDAQLLDELPTEPHDKPMRAVVTPTRIYGPFA
ncbi:5-formyltetrahydrofolate cyclo-ligase [Altererythrobacter aquiaggeris]|uniref:5-formyltetrahydrofolate cyclo-ligase n=1 Tax=Aestuarierythrobacter aquiaggeris TaxID=1898396 RepID=UPI003019F571